MYLLKKRAAIFISSIFFLIIPVLVFAQVNTRDFKIDPSTTNFGLNEAKTNIGSALGEKDPIVIVFDIIKFVLGLLGLIAVILVMYAGFLWMTSRGNPESIKKAKGIMIAGVIGLAIILAAFGITSFVIQNVQSISGGT